MSGKAANAVAPVSRGWQPCRFGDKCTRSECTFKHPKGPSRATRSASADNGGRQPKPSKDAAGKSGKNQEGKKQDGKKPDVDKNATRRPSFSSTSAKPQYLGMTPTDCTYADRCTRNECTFMHPSGSLCPSFPKACATPGACSTRHPPIIDRSEMAECRNRDVCTIKQCVFRHPSGPLCSSYPSCCAIATCKLRHPKSKPQARPGLPPQAPTPSPGAAKSSQKKSIVEPDSARAGSSVDSHFTRAVQLHEKAIFIEEQKLHSLRGLVNEHVGIDVVEEDTIKAVQAKITEMRKQLRVFQTITARIETRQDLSATEKRNLSKREIYRFRNRLPALSKRLEIEACLQSSRFTIVQGQTGSGKSTQIPQYAADLECFAKKRVLCTQPRKLAATSLATRVAFEYSGGWDQAKVGHAVGFRIGGRAKRSPKTRIEFVTEAILLDMIMKARCGSGPNPFQDVGCVIIDEAHERSITCDLLMGSFKELHPRWKDVKVVVTSATIDLAMFSAFYDNAPAIEIEGRTFPVDINYVAGRDGLLDASSVAVTVAECAMEIHKSYSDPEEGDILCFLPGQDDVLRAKQHFEAAVAKPANKSQPKAFRQVVVHALYGKQDPEEQALVFQKHTGPRDQRKRKVIFSTDIAETSVTIDGVVFVVDCGLKKGMVFDPNRNMSSLKVQSVSRSSAIQRTGRAGRTQPGKCFRLYAEKEYNEMEIGNTAEIFRQPLSLAMLTLHTLGMNPRQFNWIQAPSDEAMARAEKELTYLGVLNPNGGVTELGALVSEVQIDPKVVRMIDRAARRGFGCVATDLAAVMSVSNIFFWRGGSDKKSKTKADSMKARQVVQQDGDIVSMYRVYCDWKMVLENGEVSSADSPQKPLATGANSGNDIEDNGDDDDDAEPEVQTMIASVHQNLMKMKMNAGTNRLFKHDSDDTASETSDIALSFNDSDGGQDDLDECASPPKQKSPSKVQAKKNKFQREQLARNWCMEHSVNGKALGMAYAFSKELRGAFGGSSGWKSTPNNAIDGSAVDGEAIRRLITTGYFMNASRIKPITRGLPQYYALYSNVLGSLFAGSAINSKRSGKGGDSNPDVLPSWIIFDNILRLTSTTYLSAGTPIKEEWINEESPAFYQLCKQKELDLPIELLEWENVASEIIRSVFGKGFSKLGRVETRLKCNLSVDAGSGKIIAYCAPRAKTVVKAELEKLIFSEQSKMAKETIEEVYMDTTRAVLGNGFEVSELLFAREFSTLYVKNLSQKTEKELIQLVDGKWSGLNHASAVRTIDLVSHVDGKMSATIKLTSKEAAKEIYDNIRGETSGAEIMEVSPGASRLTSSKGGLKQDFAGRIKLTWSDGESNQEAKVFFPSAADGNNFITNCGSIKAFETAIPVAVGISDRPKPASSAIGPIGRQKTSSSDKLPPLKKVPHPNQPGKDVSLFDEDKIRSMSASQQVNLDFGVKIKGGLPVSMDEVELLGLVRPIPVLYAKVSRRAVKTQANDDHGQGVLEQRFQRMLPLLSFLDNSAVHTDFYDHASCRVGVMVYFDDLRRLEETFINASESDLWDLADKPNGQPVRMELEYTYTTSLHLELYGCYEQRIAHVMTYARSKGVITEEVQPQIGNASAAAKAMVALKFRSASLPILRRIREQLEACLECEKVVGEHVSKLFSYTGRMKAQKLQSASIKQGNRQTFIRWISKKQEFWVYGEQEPRRKAVQVLLDLSIELSGLEVVDKIVRLDRFKLMPNKPGNRQNQSTDFANAQKMLKEVISSCPQKLFYYQINGVERVMLSGSDAAVKAAMATLKIKGLLLKQRERGITSTTPECGVCYSDVCDPFITLALCNHVFCVECIRPGLTTSGNLPLKCPTGCGALIHVNDIVKIAENQDVSSLVENAVFEYVASHSDTCVICPKPGCNQILPANETMQGKHGGNFIFCESCLHYYCIDCSKKTGRHVDRHDDESCEDIQSGGLSKIAMHLHHIQEKILNLWCPSCESPFLDFSGCTSVECGNSSCKKYFCANCLEYSSPSSTDTHRHVQICPKNPSPATGGLKSYFVCEKELGYVHQDMRQQKLVAYFNVELKNESLRHGVYTRIAKDLLDLSIELPKSLRGNANGGFSPLQMHATHIREELLNLRCPACHLVFIDFDFDQCAALTCAQPSCNRGFCAYCLADCGEDAHKHVGSCELNPNRPYFYVTEEVFTTIHKQRREQAISTYLIGVYEQDAELARSIWKEVNNDVKHLGLDVKCP